MTATRPRALFRGAGVAVPPLEITNEMLSRVMDTSDEWIRARSGYRHPLLRRARYGLRRSGRRGVPERPGRCRHPGGRGGLPGLCHDDAGPLLPGDRVVDPAAPRDRPAPGARHPPAVRRFRLRTAGRRRPRLERRRPHGSAGGDRRPHVAHSLARPVLGGPVRPRRGAAGGRGPGVERSVPAPLCPVRRRGGSHGPSPPTKPTTDGVSSAPSSMPTVARWTSSTSRAWARPGAPSSMPGRLPTPTRSP